MPGPFSGHSYITGAVLIGIGGLGIYGSFSGNLATMIAALFSPQYLSATVPPKSPGVSGDIAGDIVKELNPLTSPLNPVGFVNTLKGLIP
jgi:hypothetical protein